MGKQENIDDNTRDWLVGLLARTDLERPVMRDLQGFGFEELLRKDKNESLLPHNFHAMVSLFGGDSPNQDLLQMARELDEKMSTGDGRAFKTADQLSAFPGKYDAALPVLLKYIGEPWQESINANHIRLFATKGALPYWPQLKKLFLETDMDTRPKTKEALAVALTEIVEKNKGAHLDELIALCLDTSHGMSRKHFTHALERSKRPEAAETLARLAGDPDIENSHFASIGRGAALRYVLPNTDEWLSLRK